MKKYIAYVSAGFESSPYLIFSDSIVTIAHECSVKFEVDKVRKRVEILQTDSFVRVEIFKAKKTSYSHFVSLDLEVSTDDLCELLEEEIFKPKKS